MQVTLLPPPQQHPTSCGDILVIVDPFIHEGRIGESPNLALWYIILSHNLLGQRDSMVNLYLCRYLCRQKQLTSCMIESTIVEFVGE